LHQTKKPETLISKEFQAIYEVPRTGTQPTIL